MIESSKDNIGFLRVAGNTLKISYKNKPETVKAKGMFLVYCVPVSKMSVKRIFIIIITNKNNTIIAPKYIKIYDIPKKGIPLTIKNSAEFKTKEIKNITEIIGFLAVITNIEDKMALNTNISNNMFFIFNNNIWNNDHTKISDLKIFMVIKY